jgi:HAD domain in Swiss Army Knife RNA repair proteins
MKIVFSDIDGVLNCKSTPNPRKFPYVADPQLVERLRQLLQRSRAEVVLTSTWRYDPAGLFSAKHWGIPFIDITPDLPHEPRRNEILSWLAGHPEVTRYAVLDDDDDDLDSLPLFQPSARRGLTKEVAQALVDYLDGKREHDMRASRMVRWIENLQDVLKRHPG